MPGDRIDHYGPDSQFNCREKGTQYYTKGTMDFSAVNPNGRRPESISAARTATDNAAMHTGGSGGSHGGPSQQAWPTETNVPTINGMSIEQYIKTLPGILPASSQRSDFTTDDLFNSIEGFVLKLTKGNQFGGGLTIAVEKIQTGNESRASQTAAQGTTASGLISGQDYGNQVTMVTDSNMDECTFGYQANLSMKRDSPEMDECKFGYQSEVTLSNNAHLDECKFGYKSEVTLSNNAHLDECKFGFKSKVTLGNNAHLDECKFDYQSKVAQGNNAKMKKCQFALKSEVILGNNAHLDKCKFGDQSEVTLGNNARLDKCEFGYDSKVTLSIDAKLSKCSFGKKAHLTIQFDDVPSQTNTDRSSDGAEGSTATNTGDFVFVKSTIPSGGPNPAAADGTGKAPKPFQPTVESDDDEEDYFVTVNKR